MKKITVLFLAAVLAAVLCGCSVSDYSEPEQQYIVSAIGFDDDGGSIKVSVEVIVIKGEKTDSDLETRIFSGSGKTIEQAFNQLSGGIAKGLMLTHCGVVIIGDTIDKKELNEIFDYCFHEESITLAANMLAAQSAEQLLRCQSISTPVVGYDLISLLREKSKYIGIGQHSTFYRLQAQRSNTRNIFALPYFMVNNDGSESTYALNGLKIFTADTAAVTLNQSDSILYSMICNQYRGGLLSLEQADTVRQAAVFGSSTETAFSYEQGKLNIGIRVHITLSDKQTGNIDRDGLRKAVEQSLLQFTQQVKKSADTDSFGFANMLSAADKQLWKDISNDYDTEYNRADIAVSCDITQKD